MEISTPPTPRGLHPFRRPDPNPPKSPTQHLRLDTPPLPHPFCAPHPIHPATASAKPQNPCGKPTPTPRGWKQRSSAHTSAAPLQTRPLEHSPRHATPRPRATRPPPTPAPLPRPRTPYATPQRVREPKTRAATEHPPPASRSDAPPPTPAPHPYKRGHSSTRHATPKSNTPAPDSRTPSTPSHPLCHPTARARTQNPCGNRTPTTREQKRRSSAHTSAAPLQPKTLEHSSRHAQEQHARPCAPAPLLRPRTLYATPQRVREPRKGAATEHPPPVHSSSAPPPAPAPHPCDQSYSSTRDATPKSATPALNSRTPSAPPHPLCHPTARARTQNRCENSEPVREPDNRAMRNS
ncbi:Uncharacterised protein [Nocardia brasiliensis]|nr:Uncharacterised protein [Nocardia brasiliensis]